VENVNGLIDKLRELCVTYADKRCSGKSGESFDRVMEMCTAPDAYSKIFDMLTSSDDGVVLRRKDIGGYDISDYSKGLALDIESVSSALAQYQPNNSALDNYIGTVLRLGHILLQVEGARHNDYRLRTPSGTYMVLNAEGRFDAEILATWGWALDSELRDQRKSLFSYFRNTYTPSKNVQLRTVYGPHSRYHMGYLEQGTPTGHYLPICNDEVHEWLENTYTPRGVALITQWAARAHDFKANTPALVLMNGSGCGKGVLTRALIKFVTGQEESFDLNYLDGKFRDPLKRSPMCRWDEIDFKEIKVNKFKEFVTDSMTEVESKYGTKDFVKGHRRLIINTNNGPSKLTPLFGASQHADEREALKRRMCGVVIAEGTPRRDRDSWDRICAGEYDVIAHHIAFLISQLSEEERDANLEGVFILQGEHIEPEELCRVEAASGSDEGVNRVFQVLVEALSEVEHNYGKTCPELASWLRTVKKKYTGDNMLVAINVGGLVKWAKGKGIDVDGLDIETYDAIPVGSSARFSGGEGGKSVVRNARMLDTTTLLEWSNCDHNHGMLPDEIMEKLELASKVAD
jgi:hypothetical protein